MFEPVSSGQVGDSTIRAHHILTEKTKRFLCGACSDILLGSKLLVGVYLQSWWEWPRDQPLVNRHGANRLLVINTDTWNGGLSIAATAWSLTTVAIKCTSSNLCYIVQQLCTIISLWVLFHVCLRNINIDQEIDAGIGICYTLNALMAYGLSALMALLQSSAQCGEHLHWSLPAWLPDMVQWRNSFCQA